MFKKLQERLAAMLGPHMQAAGLRILTERQQESVITRRAVRDGDALPGRETPITYEIMIPGAFRMRWNPDVALEPVELLSTTAAGSPITHPLLREAIIQGAIEETRAGVEGYAPRARVNEEGQLAMRHEAVASPPAGPKRRG